MSVFGVSAYYISKKTKKRQFFKKGENGIIELKDGMYLSNQTNAFLFEVAGNKVFTVISNNGIQSIQLQDKNFKNTLSESLNHIDDNIKGSDYETDNE